MRIISVKGSYPLRSSVRSTLHKGHLFPMVFACALTATLLGCGGNADNPTALTISPPSATVDPGATASFTATVTGGPAGTGVSWSLIGCSALTCGTLSKATTTGVTYTAPATVGTAFTVTLTAASTADSNLTAGSTITVPTNASIITIQPTSLPSATFGAPYAATLTGTGGTPPYTWSISQGALPAGLSLSSAGFITGALSGGGGTSFTVTLTDSSSPPLTATANYTIAAIYPPLLVTSTALPNGVEGTAYSATLAAVGGSGSGYTWAVTSGTALSAVGLTLTSSGTITGTPNSTENFAPLTVQVTDSAGNTATANLTLTVTSVAYQGQVLSGTNPVAGATLQLYAVGATGNSSAAIPMLTQTVTSNGLGMFQLNGLYTCGQSNTGQTIPGSDPVYLVATGGGAVPASTATTTATSTSSNAALILVTAIGACSNLNSTPQFTTNEVTTAAAAWALSAFASSATDIGASATNLLGIGNAFLDAALLANPATGGDATLPTNLAVETGKLNALADALNSCTSGNGSTCAALFTAATPANGTAPIDTFTAALNIVRNPGQNVAAVYAAIAAAPPFATAPLTASPNDWTMSLTVSGGGLFMPTALGIDSQNNLWVANQDGPLSAFNAQGTPLSTTGYGLVSGVSVINEVFGLAIDPSNNIWVTNTNGGSGAGSVTEFHGVNNPNTLGTNSTYSDGSISYPYALAADTNGDIYIANSGTSSATVYNSTGGLVAASLGMSLDLADTPNAIALDASNGFWLSGNENVAHVSSSGTLLTNAVCCAESYGIATDAAGDLWIADYLGGSDGHGAVAEAVTDSSGNTAVPLSGLSTGGIAYPAMVAVDAAQNVWISNFHGASITEIASSTGTAISPTIGVHGPGGYGLDASLDEPFSLLPDRSGNLWVSNEGVYTITMFFGLAAPTVTPLQPVPTAP